MQIDRRTLMKGMLAGGALLVLGIPSWAFADSFVRRPRPCRLLLGSTGADAVFASGARAACAGMAYEGFETVNLNGGLLTNTDRVAELLEHSRGTRWIAVMDDASSIIFLELARTAGARLLTMGTHACSTDSSCPLRHMWATTSAAQSIGGLAASQFIRMKGTFSITETFLQDQPGGRELTVWSAPGFCSYRSAEPDAIHVHCSGLSLPDGCRLLGLDSSEGWTPIPSHVCEHDSVTWRPENWIAAVGYAVTTSALGMDSVIESCSGRAFVHQSTYGEKTRQTERFVSFVMDI